MLISLGNNEKIVHLWAKRLHLWGRGGGITMISAPILPSGITGNKEDTRGPLQRAIPHHHPG